MGFNFRNAVSGAAAGVAKVAENYMDTAIKTRAALDLEKVRSEITLDREKRLHEWKSTGRREVGAAILEAGKPVTETSLDEGGNEITSTRTRSRAEQLAAGERRAFELGEFDTAKTLRSMGGPQHTKVGQDETVINETGEVVYANTAGAERRRRDAEDKHRRDMELADYKAKLDFGMRLRLEEFKAKNGPDKATAMIGNINFMVENGIAPDPKAAFEMLRTTMSKSEDQAVLDLAKTLMRGPGYRGRDGQQRALDDAENLVGSIRRREPGRDSRANSGAYSTAESVRDAYRAGRISRDVAERELRQFGFQ